MIKIPAMNNFFPCSRLFLMQLLILLRFMQSRAQTDRGLVTYKLGTDTSISQYFEIDNTKFKTTILSLTGQVVKYEGTGDLDAAVDLIKVQSKLYNMDSMGNWIMLNEGTNEFNGDSS